MDKVHYQYSRTVAIIDIVKWRLESEIEQRICNCRKSCLRSELVSDGMRSKRI